MSHTVSRRWTRRAIRAGAGLLLAAVAAGCTGGGDDGSAGGAPTSTPAGDPSASRDADATPSPSPTPTPVNPVSIQALIEREHEGSDLRLGEVLNRTDAYTRYAVTYEANGLTISGVLNIPEGEGPFPAVVLAHGYIDPDEYNTGQGLMREQDYLAREGYVVLHTDYRNHAGSDDDPDSEVHLRLGYTEDVIGAVLALRSSDRPEIDADRIGLLGRSMGGGIVYNTLVVAPGLVDAAVAFAPVSARPAENLEQFGYSSPRLPDGTAPDPNTAAIEAEHGTPEENPEFWAGADPLTRIDRVTDPLLIHHGTEDTTCPPVWSEDVVTAFEAAGKDVQRLTYPGEGHTFGPLWPDSMAATTSFFEQHLR